MSRHPWEGIKIKCISDDRVFTTLKPEAYSPNITAVSEDGVRAVIPLAQLQHILGIQPIWVEA